MAFTGYMNTDDSDPLRMETDLECSCCQQEIEATEEVIFLSIVQVQKIGEEISFIPVTKPDNGDYQFAPLFVHLDYCWKEIDEDIRAKVEDELPVEDSFSLLSCSICKSGIRQWEYVALGEYGEFYSSPHQPNKTNQVSYNFVPWGGRATLNVQICLACVSKIGEEMLDDWEDVSQMGECVFCTLARCWRTSPCSCFCHLPDEK